MPYRSRAILIFFTFAALSLSKQTLAQSADSRAWTYEGMQVFTARVQLQAYRDELYRAGVGKRMGVEKTFNIDPHHDGFFTYFGKSIRLLAFNTFNAGRLVLTNEESQLLAEWLHQVTELDHAIAALHVVYNLMDSRGVRLLDAYRIVNSESRYEPVRSWVSALAKSSWSHRILTRAALPKRPLIPADVGLNFKSDFINDKWQSLISEQITIANVYVFMRGPQTIALMAKTKLGASVAKTLRLDKLIALAKSLPPKLQGPALWMIYETADGCTIRYFQMAILGVHQLWHGAVTRLTDTVPANAIVHSTFVQSADQVR